MLTLSTLSYVTQYCPSNPQGSTVIFSFFVFLKRKKDDILKNQLLVITIFFKSFGKKSNVDVRLSSRHSLKLILNMVLECLWGLMIKDK